MLRARSSMHPDDCRMTTCTLCKSRAGPKPNIDTQECWSVQGSLQQAVTLVMTSRLRSMRFMSRLLIMPFTYATAPSTSFSISIFSRLVVITSRTSRQLSRRTVSMPCGTARFGVIRSCTAQRVHGTAYARRRT